MDDRDLILALGQLKGSVEATNKHVTEEFVSIKQDLKDYNEENKKQNEAILAMLGKHATRLTNLETERKIAAKTGAIYGMIAGTLTMSIIKIGQSLVSMFFSAMLK